MDYAELFAATGPMIPNKYDGPRCGRLTAKKTPCRLPLTPAWSQVWAEALDLPVPHSCAAHLTDREKTIARMIKAKLEERKSRADHEPPACHTWPAPAPGQNLWDWQDRRCAICGDRRKARLLEDHCHESGLVRGQLCTTCNIREGLGNDGKFQQYRERPPTVMVGETWPYYFIVGGEDAEPSAKALRHLGPRPTDRAGQLVYLAKAGRLPRHEHHEDGWENNATTGLLRRKRSEP